MKEKDVWSTKIVYFFFKPGPQTDQGVLTQQTWRSNYKAGHELNLYPEALKTETRILNVVTKVNSSIFIQFTAKANSLWCDLGVLLMQVSSAKIWTKTKWQIFHKLVVSRKVRTLCTGSTVEKGLFQAPGMNSHKKQ